MRRGIITCTRKHQIAVGHRVVGQGGKCEHLHGHNLTFEITCQAEALDDVGRVIDFGVMKSKLCEYLETHWDHRTLIWSKDPWLPMLRDIDQTVVEVPLNPTSENLAFLMGAHVGPRQLAGTGVRIVRCRVHETDKCYATWAWGVTTT